MGKSKKIVPVLQPTFGDTGEMIRKFQRLFESRQITLGTYTRELEQAVSDYLGVPHVVAVSSCTSGLILALKALRLEGEVILPAFTFAASAHALVWCGLRPVFCDCDRETLSIDTRRAEELITKRTAALMPVYIFGSAPDWEPLERISKKHSIPILADAAQGLGASYQGRKAGRFGAVEIFSLSPTKIITAGEGGLITTRDGDLARTLRKLRDYGKAEDGEDMEMIGLSARLSEFHAVIALENLKWIDVWMEKRRGLIDTYREGLDGLPGIRYPTLPEGSSSSWNYMVLLIDNEIAPFGRDDLYLRLKEKGIQTKRYFYPPAHLLAVYREMLGPDLPSLPATELISRQALALPLYSHMSEVDVRAICGSIRSCA
ncbi:MAG: DegT/DnrJ/EryC1/StrS family aminotransferase, partial [Acidobacteriota bacterium]